MNMVTEDRIRIEFALVKHIGVWCSTCQNLYLIFKIILLLAGAGIVIYISWRPSHDIHSCIYSSLYLVALNGRNSTLEKPPRRDLLRLMKTDQQRFRVIHIHYHAYTAVTTLTHPSHNVETPSCNSTRLKPPETLWSRSKRGVRGSPMIDS